MKKKRQIILGTRGSKLALWQAGYVKELLENEYQDLTVTLKVIKTSGDKLVASSVSEVGGKGLFLKEIEEDLLAEKIHVGVHSMKDVPADLPPGLIISTILKRDDPRDAFISKKYNSLLELPKKAKVATGSVRRKAQLKNFRPDFEIMPVQGNVDTRLKKLQVEKWDAMILAAAGLSRLGLADRINEYLPTSLMLPAVGQGALGLEIREKDETTRRLIDFMNDIETANCVLCERAFMKALGGDCQSPIAAFAEIHGQNLKVTGMVATPDGRELIRDRMEGNIREAKSLGEQLAKQLLQHGAREILRACRK